MCEIPGIYHEQDYVVMVPRDGLLFYYLSVLYRFFYSADPEEKIGVSILQCLCFVLAC